MGPRVRGKERDRGREEWIPYITSTCSSRYRNQFAARYRFATTRIFLSRVDAPKRFISHDWSRDTTWEIYRTQGFRLSLVEKWRKENCARLPRGKKKVPIRLLAVPVMSVLVQRWDDAFLGPRTTGALQFRGVGVMKAIIQRARERWPVPTV